MGWLRKLADWADPSPVQARAVVAIEDPNSMNFSTARLDAKNRLKLVLMHDRTQISPVILEKMRDDMVEVISRYVEIDREALEVNLENETNSIALVASIPVLRTRVV